MNWDDLRFVLAVRREGTLIAAGASLGVAHTTVGRRLRTIEDQLAVRLFDRTPGGFEPTPAGLDLSNVAERIEGEVLSAEGRLLGWDARLEGKLRVSTLDFLYMGFQADFATFRQHYPSVELTVTTLTRAVSLPRREADVVLRLSNSPPETLVGRKVGQMQFAVYGSRGLVKRMGPTATLDDYPWIGMDEREDGRWLEGWLARNAPRARFVMRTDGSTAVIRRALAEGVGLFFLPCFEGDEDPNLRRMSQIEHSFARDLWLLTMPEHRGTSRVRAFMEHMAEALRARREGLAGHGVIRE